MEKRSKIAIPPGATIEEQLEDKNMSLKEFASKMGMPKEQIRKLMDGKTQLTPEIADRLEIVLGVPAEFWSKLETIYREKENTMERKIGEEYVYVQFTSGPFVKVTVDIYEGKTFDECVKMRSPNIEAYYDYEAREWIPI